MPVEPFEALPGLLPWAEVVVLTVPMTDETRGLVDAGFLAALPDGALVVNVVARPGRGHRRPARRGAHRPAARRPGRHRPRAAAARPPAVVGPGRPGQPARRRRHHARSCRGRCGWSRPSCAGTSRASRWRTSSPRRTDVPVRAWSPGPRTDELGQPVRTGDAGRPRAPKPVVGRRAGVRGLVAVAVVRPDLSLHGEAPRRSRGPAAARPATRTGDPGRRPSPGTPAATWRSDRGFVSGAVTRIRQDRPDVARIFFAGRLPGRRPAGAGRQRRLPRHRRHRGARAGGRAGGGHRRRAGHRADGADRPAAAARPGPAGAATGTCRVVVLSRPGPVRFELSPSVQLRRRRDAAPDLDPGLHRGRRGRHRPGHRGRPGRDGPRHRPACLTTPSMVRVVEPGPRPAGAAGPGAAGDPSYQRAGPGPAGPRPPRSRPGQLADLVDRPGCGCSGAGRRGSSAGWRWCWSTRPDGVRLQALVGQQGELASSRSASGRCRAARRPSCPGCWSRSRPTTRPTCSARPARARVVYQRPAGRTARLAVAASGAVVLVEPGAGAADRQRGRVTLLDPDGHELLTTMLPEAGIDDPLRCLSSSLADRPRAGRWRRAGPAAARAGRTAGCRPRRRGHRPRRRAGSGWRSRRRPGSCRSG